MNGYISPNQDPEQIARDKIDLDLIRSGWIIQDKENINLNAGIGVVVRSYLTQDGKETDYVMFVDKKPVGIIEAKREEEGHRLTVHEAQSEEYAVSKLKYLDNDPLPFVYESTGDITRFTDFRDTKPRSRPVFTFNRPETFSGWLKKDRSLRSSLLDLPALPTEKLRECQIIAINNLERSFKQFKPKALIQMATGSGKTYTAITSIYRLLKFTQAKRILFLVDTKNLGEQAEQEFMAYLPNDDNRKFTELYGVHRLKSSFIPTDNQVYISTIQRLYSILKGTELEESSEEENPNESRWQPKEPMPVVYNEKLPVEFFDVIVIDECHRSIYNLWKQVLEYFDAFQVGLTATPDNRTFGYFNQNIVSEYTHERAVADGVNVGYDVFEIETKISNQGGTIWKGEYVERRERLSRRKRWEMQDEDETYNPRQENDFLMVWDGSRSGYIGKAIKGALGSTLVKINFPGIENDYAYYFLLSKYLQINTRAKGTGTPHVDPDLLWNYKFPIAPFKEQTRIVAKVEELFTELDKGIEQLEAAQQQLKVYRQAVLKWAFEGKLTNENVIEGELPKSWEWKTLGDVFESVKNGFGKKPDDEGSKKILRISSVRPFSVNLSDVRYLKKDLAVDYEIAENDLLFTRYNGSIEFVGVCGRVPELKEKTFYPDKLIRCRPFVKERFHAAYVEYAVNAGVSRKFVLSKIKTTAGQTGISGGELKQVPIPIAPLKEQEIIVQEIESRLSVCDKIEETIETALKQSEILRYSILKKAFEGKLVPQNPNDEPATKLLEKIRADKEKNAPEKKTKKKAFQKA